MLFKSLKADFEFVDQRGSLTQLVHDGYKQINYITSKKDTERGGHLHNLNDEAFFVISGSFEFLAETENEKQLAVFKAGDFFKVFKGVKHSFKYLEDSSLISLYTQGVELENGQKDIATDF